jgi:hypothetical protein
MNDDAATRKHTAFGSMEEMLNAGNCYRPTFATYSAPNLAERIELGRLADAYDAYQHARGDKRRAIRF